MRNNIQTASLAERIKETIGGGYVIAAFFSTYTFSRDFFEQEVVKLIADEGRRRGFFPLTIVMDRSQYRGNGWGYDIVRHPERMWHAKLIALFVENPELELKWTVLAIGSGNLTRAGWERNQELYLVHSWNGWILPEAIDSWMKEPWLSECKFGRWFHNNRIKIIAKNQRASIFTNLKKPIWNQLNSLTGYKKWNEAHVLAPFSDNFQDEEQFGGTKSFFRMLTERAHSASNLHIYLRGIDSEGKSVIGERRVFESLARKIRLHIHPVLPFEDRQLHAKLFAFRVGNSWSLIIGSPNATGAAMIFPNKNIELAWEFARIGKSQLGKIIPRCKEVQLSKLFFKKPAFMNKRRWEALESAIYLPKANRLRITWKVGFGPKNTKILLDDKIINPFRINIETTNSRFLETRPRIPTKEKYEPGFVPIQMPSGYLDLPTCQFKKLSPEEWLELLGKPFSLELPKNGPGAGENGGNGAARNIERHQFIWRDRVAKLSGSLKGLRETIRNAGTPQTINYVDRIVRGVWASHNPRKYQRFSTEHGWCKWVRSGLWQVLREECDGRSINHRGLCNLLNKWSRKIDGVLKEFPIA
ncbi:MAG: hypothetical protein ABSF48_20135 [Thermodesulfobacteriota bacterium]|jgi:hypothetical protein